MNQTMQLDNQPVRPEAAAQLEVKVAEVAALLRELGNEKRLMILCTLVETGELRVNDLVEKIGLSQSALSQHLARLRDEKLVTYRRDSQTLWYRIADRRIEDLIAQLHRIYCADSDVPDPRSAA